jgi:hypothetical protein
VNGGYFCCNAVLVATKVDQAVKPFVTTTTVAAGDNPTIVATFAAVFGHHQ